VIKLLDITALIYCINYRVIDCAIVTQFQTCKISPRMKLFLVVRMLAYTSV